MNELYIDSLSGNEFEIYLINLFKGLGYSVDHTPVSGDYGADLVIAKDSKRTVVQAKRYSNTVGLSSVQEVLGAKNYYGANKCLVVTNNFFTKNAIELAKVNNVELWDRDVLIKMAILSIDPSFNIDPSKCTKENKNDKSYNTEDLDDLLLDAIYLVVSQQMVSISMLQRQMDISYSRSARIIDQMESEGIVGAYIGAQPRKILISPSDLNNLNTVDSGFDIPLDSSYQLKSNHKNNRSILNKILGLIFSLSLSAFLIFICILNIKNSITNIVSIFVSILLSYKIGFLLSDKVFNVYEKRKN